MSEQVKCTSSCPSASHAVNQPAFVATATGVGEIHMVQNIQVSPHVEAGAAERKGEEEKKDKKIHKIICFLQFRKKKKT